MFRQKQLLFWSGRNVSAKTAPVLTRQKCFGKNSSRFGPAEMFGHYLVSYTLRQKYTTTYQSKMTVNVTSMRSRHILLNDSGTCQIILLFFVCKIKSLTHIEPYDIFCYTPFRNYNRKKSNPTIRYMSSRTNVSP
jgi:hypothetical protein